ncbi:DUF5721 family protein [Candidatus Galacturonibacter soehngenii]|uniref:Uncharacterized protein n=1 Tax=Candidatus Galacturonatibacter soehngenii TaxID=2307010 RepID=A0A7V7QN68_9FIRM|nr:DUF5721 family protein [Candidatus Galacturonibacter soehngenii]KAB1440420.1 hypothetical protein F7O84_00890 [Candidatus Galacturonibacter soehngenii]MBA4688942.1 hypothetical protein [Candidatus Galacturonibacter soehngenii]
MIALKIIDVKDFMSKLLISDTFHRFMLSEATINTYNSFTIDGHINKEYYSKEELEEKNLLEQSMSYWETIQPYCFGLIKGKKTPLGFKIVFLLSPSNVEKLLNQTNIGLGVNDINGLFLNIKYNNNEVHCTTGTSLKLFTLDKSLENEWDMMVQKFLKSNEIAFEVI